MLPSPGNDPIEVRNRVARDESDHVGVTVSAANGLTVIKDDLE